MLVWVASYPRSGNSFFRTALHRLYGHRSVREQTRGVEPPGGGGIACDLWTKLTDAEMAAHEEVYFVKTHELPHESKCPAIYLVRDGRDSLVSYAWFSLVQHRELRREQVTHDLYRQALHDVMHDTRGAYGGWANNVLAWSGRPNTCVLKFEELIAAPERCVARAIESLSLPGKCLGGDVPSFAELQAARPHHYRRGVIGSWRDEFPDDLLDDFWRLHGRAMEATGYLRDGSNHHATDEQRR